MIASKIKFAASLYALMSISFWGISFVSTKAVLDKLDPYTLLVLRFGIGALFLLVLLVLKRYPLNIPLKYIPHLIVLGILGVFVHQVIQATALLTINASAAGWIISFSPVFTVILSVFFLHEKMTVLKASGMIVAIIGVLLVTTSNNQQSFQLSINVGYLLMILSTLNWAIYSVLLKRLHIQLPSLVVTFYMCLIGFTLTTPFLVRNKGWEMMPFLTNVEWAHLLFLGVFVSGVAYWYWAKALEVLEASQVSVFLYLEPVATLVTAILLLQEKIIPVSILGGIIIIIGVILVNGRLLTFLRYLPWRNKNL
ncbi:MULTISPECIES: DMT family transporter [Priestia]|jgi:drug/metabolite transporter (DMT)-like permease|uniref:EamA/RhaT family transporter n=4 Tax=Priestia TaxID=2800373 RepID=A0AAE5UDC5_PRIMG|nr:MULTISPECIES: DMT family transporter [Priestia]KOP70078.1 multidrug transporter [Bacillus sp. FJAT-21351]KQU17323.1 multidrug transporter [Bacillus sp. Leaf75]MDH6656809.1 drug/metabolite transporter (DMT)-like permease [Bacillus sp. PvP124]RFB21852.1 DMT family transporter [Bacillus sp. ALD]RFB34411.1 DMT family transporter [Bacillus sp. RC]